MNNQLKSKHSVDSPYKHSSYSRLVTLHKLLYFNSNTNAIDGKPEKWKNASLVTDEELQVVCLDLLEAGMETVSNTAVFMLLHIVCNDDVQRLLHDEIDNVIGPLRPPTLGDRARFIIFIILDSLFNIVY